MKLENFLSRKRSVIVNKWFDLILETYPAETSRLLRKKDQFTNPVGYTISQTIEALYGALLRGVESHEIFPILENLIRIKAVQDFPPSRSMAFIFLLKKAIRSELLSEAQEDLVVDELLVLESRIDNLALLSFDIYMKCREKLYELRTNEAKNAYFRLLQRAHLLCGAPEQGPTLHDGANESST